jgi:hypothetical protein
VEKLTDDRQEKAQQILVEVREALQSDEHALQLAPALRGAQAKAVQLLTKPIEVPTPPPVGPLLEPQVMKGRVVVKQDSKEGLTIPEAEACLSQVSRELKPEQTARINLGWVIEEGGGA